MSLKFNNGNNTLLNRQGKINSLQTVRALAFLGIFSSHCGVTQLGAWGVSVFFVLSGFLMMYSYQNRVLKSSFKDCILFSINKIKKLYWLYILMMLIALVHAAKLLFLDFSVKNVFILFGKVVLNALLLQTWVPSSDVYFSLNGVSWYLSACLFIYACFPIIFNPIKKLSLKKSIMVALSVYLIQILIGSITQYVNLPIEYFDNFSKWVTYILPLFRLGDFVIGCCFGNIFLNKELMLGKKIITLFEVIVFFALIGCQYIYRYQIGCIGSEWFRYTMLYTPTSVCIVLLFAYNKGVFSNILTFKPLIYIGNISAYTFLIHLMVIQYMNIFSAFIGFTFNWYINLIVAFALTVIFAELCNKIKLKALKKR